MAVLNCRNFQAIFVITVAPRAPTAGTVKYANTSPILILVYIAYFAYCARTRDEFAISIVFFCEGTISDVQRHNHSTVGYDVAFFEHGHVATVEGGKVTAIARWRVKDNV